jgi:Rhodopirellula transposase.
MGDPMRALLWVSKSHAKLAVALMERGHIVSASTIPVLLEKIDYRRQANRKTREGANHPDRDAQFEFINTQAAAFATQAEPVISVDTKKKEIVGDFKNGGSDYRPTGYPDLVRTHDFMDKELGKAIPYGIYDVSANAGWVTVGIDNDTAEFAVNSIRLWWDKMGRQRYPEATRILITADGGGSNGSRVRLWKRELQNFADETGLEITVCHYPPGTSKWNKIEHRLFSQISQNWRGQPLTSRLAIVELSQPPRPRLA